MGTTILGAITMGSSKMNTKPGFFIAAIVANGLIRLIDLAAGAEEFEIELLLGQIINAGIWISYFRVSKRVKATFVN